MQMNRARARRTACVPWAGAAPDLLAGAGPGRIRPPASPAGSEGGDGGGGQAVAGEWQCEIRWSVRRGLVSAWIRESRMGV